MEKYCLEDMDYVPRIQLTDHIASTQKTQMPMISESTPIASAPTIAPMPSMPDLSSSDMYAPPELDFMSTILQQFNKIETSDP